VNDRLFEFVHCFRSLLLHMRPCMIPEPSKTQVVHLDVNFKQVVETSCHVTHVLVDLQVFIIVITIIVSVVGLPCLCQCAGRSQHTTHVPPCAHTLSYKSFKNCHLTLSLTLMLYYCVCQATVGCCCEGLGRI
jgi:hypothetical protein